jgi:hypothetical protein
MPGIIFLSSVLSIVSIMCICFNVFNIKVYLKGNILKVLITISLLLSTINVIIGCKHNITYLAIPCVILFILNMLLGYVALKCKPLPNLKFRIRRFVLKPDDIKTLNYAGYNKKDNVSKTCTSIVYKHNVINITDFHLKKPAKKYIIHAKHKEDTDKYRVYDCVNMYTVKKRSLYEYMKLILFAAGCIETISIYLWIAFSKSNLNIAEYWFANKLGIDVILIIAICTFIVGTLGLFIRRIRSKIGIIVITVICYLAQISLGILFIQSLIK